MLTEKEGNSGWGWEVLQSLLGWSCEPFPWNQSQQLWRGLSCSTGDTLVMCARGSSSLLPSAQCLWAALTHLMPSRVLVCEMQKVQFALKWSWYSSPALWTGTEDKWGHHVLLHAPFWRYLLKENIHWTRILLWIAKKYSIFCSFLLPGLLISYSHHLSTPLPGLSILPCWHWSDVSNCSFLWPFFWPIPSTPPDHTQGQSSRCSEHYAPPQEPQCIFLQRRKYFQLVKRRVVPRTSLWGGRLSNNLCSFGIQTH